MGLPFFAFWCYPDLLSVRFDARQTFLPVEGRWPGVDTVSSCWFRRLTWDDCLNMNSWALPIRLESPRKGARQSVYLTLPWQVWGVWSLQFSCSVASSSLWPHGLQHTRPPCPSPIPGACSDSCPLSQWCHPTISSSVIPFSSCLQSFPASGSFPMSQLFASGGQNIGVSLIFF